MAYENIDLETLQPNGKTGEPAPTAWAKARRMFKELYDSWTASSQALAKVTPAANKLPYFTGKETAALADFTDTGRLLAGAADASTARAALSARALGNVATYLTNDTFTVPVGCKMLRVTVVGGGGGGAGASGTIPGSGGGGGGLAIKTIYNPTPGEKIAVTIGAGGAAGPKNGTAGAEGKAGGTSSFGAYCSATGGKSFGYGLAGPSGNGAGGDVNSGTGAGGLGCVRGTDTSRYFGGSGGGSNGGVSNYSVDGAGGQAPGSGGAGGGYGPENAADGSTGARNGGPGSSGMVIVEWC